MKTIISIILLLLPACTVLAQNNDPVLAYAGARGIFIWNVFEPGSPTLPARNGGVKVRIERRSPGGAQWQQMDEIAVPSTAVALFNNYRSYSRFAFDTTVLQPQSTGKCFLKLAQYRQWDSAAFYLMDPVMALASSRMWIDTTAQKQTAYEYRITQVDSNGTALRSLISNTIRYPVTTGFEQALAYKNTGSPSLATVSWYIISRKRPAYFKVFRKTGVGGAFHEIALRRSMGLSRNRDTVFLNISDEQVASGQEYYYYIQPCDAFANYSIPSDTAAVFAYDKRELPLPLGLQVKNAAGGKALQLSWQLPNPYLAGSIQVYRSANFQHDYQLVATMSPQDSLYTDYDAIPKTTYYYYLKIIDRLGNVSPPAAKAYGLLEDQQPPVPPSNVVAEATVHGIQLHWESNAPNIGGFYIYRCRGINDTMQLVSAWLPADSSRKSYSYLDTTSLLNPAYTYTYAIKQVSTSHVLSRFSDKIYVRPMAVKNLDIYPPPNVSAIRNKNAILIFWEGSEQLQEGIAGYNIYRKTVKDTGYLLLNGGPLTVGTGFYTDSVPGRPGEISYVVQSIHISGNKSRFSQPAIVTPNIIPPAAPAGIKVFRNATGALLSWNNVFDDNVTGFNIYRMERGNDTPKLLGKGNSRQYQYEDKTAGTGKTYFYYVTTIGQNQLESEASPVVTFVSE